MPKGPVPPSIPMLARCRGRCSSRQRPGQGRLRRPRMLTCLPSPLAVAAPSPPHRRRRRRQSRRRSRRRRGTCSTTRRSGTSSTTARRRPARLLQICSADLQRLLLLPPPLLHRSLRQHRCPLPSQTCWTRRRLPRRRRRRHCRRLSPPLSTCSAASRWPSRRRHWRRPRLRRRTRARQPQLLPHRTCSIEEALRSRRPARRDVGRDLRHRQRATDAERSARL
mmetsp:Transcript_50861/g.164547  ORF Transcript_50861/g.164547 Transcript_50861/m.164547 type:complete len:223 (+) Transcript_50861:1193-1861(+)